MTELPGAGKRPGDDLKVPDFRNPAVLLRVLVLSEFASLIALISYAPDGFLALLRPGEYGLVFEASLLCIVLVLYLASPLLQGIGYRQGVCFVIVMSGAVAAALQVAAGLWGALVFSQGAVRAAVVAAVMAALLLRYFSWRQRALSPVLAEAKLAALQARIRPHFLFNSLNTAASLARQEPQLAERVLLDMADLFRALLSETGRLVVLADEVRLAKCYLDIEQLRLGERLRVLWEDRCDDLILRQEYVPLLILQPLLENAVRYGVEPFSSGAEVAVVIAADGKDLTIEVSNSVPDVGSMPPSGNRIALENIRERLNLQFDVAGSLTTEVDKGKFLVRMRIPIQRGSFRKATFE
ncbi:sensor histidine kinase [Azoarcus sp. KH32C]|uniref:sensor histidine kinase n=1 Tax=Azoarcus sp. KH32C TaxID=748247 RepID=UPI000A05D86C|nr:histidine kinase [Azoarcus sp. KH32C]